MATAPIPRSQLRRTARVGLVSSKLSLRQLWARRRSRLARPVQSLGMVFDRSHPQWGALLRRLNMPPDFAIVNRLQWGLTSILSQLRATANWRAIIDEYLTEP
jgi:hypothetical protein